MTEGKTTQDPDGEAVVMTVDQLAAYLQISKRTVYNMAAAGGIPAAKVGDQWRFFRPEVDRWLAILSRKSIGDPTPVDPGGDYGDL